MAEYRRYYEPGGTVFLTIVTGRRAPRFAAAGNVARLREAVNVAMAEWPFEIVAAVVLPDHMHFLWTLPHGDAAYSKRVGRMKAKFTSLLADIDEPRSASQVKHRESGVWQRRFWEHTIRDEDDLKAHLDYIHYNPVRHGLTTCPHKWPHASFRKWVTIGEYAENWGCACDGRIVTMPNMDKIAAAAGE